MDLRSLTRPLLAVSRARLLPLPLAPQRGHKTAARTKRALKLPPHDSFLPSRASAFPAADSIIYNPPASEASPAHTPFIFLPRGDPRRLALLRMRTNPGAPPPPGDDAVSEADLPPLMKYKRRTARYHLTQEDIDEIRRLRAQDPIEWSVGRLARKFDCSDVFVKMVAPASPEHHKWLQARLESKMARWGPKKAQAREDRKRRAGMLYRGEL
ncbi:uncharacterized protein UV8b_07538 [Ustilaginoidea virens]|uniref:60S ribosomal protein L20 n=1 Tax=Ustilaginoidea virens TaxID=1159556 RepID=A0A8E5MKM3_USTVR|nr:uncharacterized protein UV8b_07538 [Ustilaginoidea virens]QUC23297.1 hypothetical protein UV8b_07538 [Ustilaginoidea virens]